MGREILYPINGSYTFKTFKRGVKGVCVTDLERMWLSGIWKLLVRYPDSSKRLLERILLPGESFHFPPYAIHQEEALEDCVILEASNPVFNDRVRCEADFNLSESDAQGLPSTAESDVIFK